MSILSTAKLVSYGFLLGTAGVSILSSKDAKNVYTHVTAAVKRGGNEIKKTYTTLKENCEDINADADEINVKRAQAARAQEIADAKAVLAQAEQEEAE